jgi:CDP-diacylglycerol--glycerol-3-phosphate 3-phosphatidyltransferase
MLNNVGVRSVMAHVIEPAARLLLRLHISPDAITVAGTVGLSAAALVFFPQAHWAWGALIVMLFVFSDLLDGTMARISGRSGPWGAFLDSTMDRVADGALFGGILLGFLRIGDTTTACVALACLVGALVVSYSKARAEAIGVPCNVGIAERPERLIVALLASLLYGVGVPYLLPAALWVLAVLTWVTVGQRIWHVRTQLQTVTELP